MCFSPEASFALGAVLLPAGAYCMRTAIKRNPAWLPLAVTPFLFGFQRHLLDWSLRNGRSAVFADCGLGKTPIALSWWPNQAGRG